MKRANLNDPPVELWEPAFQQECDAMIALGVRENGSLEQARGVLASLEPCCEFLFVQEGAELPGGIEHFGFVEGISQPLFLDEDVGRSGSSQAATPLQVVLTRDPYGAGECSYGTYVVFRKLRQDVAQFEQGLRRMAAELGISDDLAGAMTIGRFKDGTPLAVVAERGTGKHNDFDYSEDLAGAKCPFASHVRRSNPRGELDHVSHGPDWLSRIARRGLPYGHAGDADVGLLFVCYQSDISLGFELIQNNWCNFPDFPRVRVGVDPIIGQKNTWDPTDGQCWPAEGTETGTARFGFPQCVTMLGGEYFFQPSLSFLHSIRDLKAGKGCCKGPQL
jgi:Dyp-type peroxidase family